MQNSGVNFQTHYEHDMFKSQKVVDDNGELIELGGEFKRVEPIPIEIHPYYFIGFRGENVVVKGTCDKHIETMKEIYDTIIKENECTTVLVIDREIYKAVVIMQEV